MRGPRIGALRRRLRIEVPSLSAKEGGGAAVAWQSMGTMWAELIPLAGREVFQADGVSAIAMYEIRTRFRAEVTPEMRFVMGERVFEIRAVRDIEGRRRWLSCLCEERVS